MLDAECTPANGTAADIVRLNHFPGANQRMHFARINHTNEQTCFIPVVFKRCAYEMQRRAQKEALFRRALSESAPLHKLGENEKIQKNGNSKQRFLLQVVLEFGTVHKCKLGP
jgi:hypothetical protein